MKKPRKSEKLVLLEIFEAAEGLRRAQRGISIGQVISLIRTQLSMSQRALAKRAGVPQSTVSRIERERLAPNERTLRKICDALSCDLLITALPRENLQAIRQRQARVKAEKRIRYLKGTMSLEDQEPDQKLIDELINEEISCLLNSTSGKLWEDE